MAILNKEETKPTIDLTSSQGNAFALLGHAMHIGKQLGISKEKIKDKMMSSDYNNLVLIFDEYFGVYVDLIR